MKYLNTTQRVLIPDGVTVSIKSRIVTVKGPKGEVTKDISHMPLDIHIKDSIKHEGKKDISITRWFANYKRRPLVKTCAGIFKSMFNGVTKGYRFKLRCVSAHFPIKVYVADDQKSVEFKNFLGGTQVKLVVMKPGCSVYLNPKNKEEIVVDGIDIDYVSQSCALINQCVNVGKKDVRKFLDGIYVSERGFQEVEE